MTVSVSTPDPVRLKPAVDARSGAQEPRLETRLDLVPTEYRARVIDSIQRIIKAAKELPDCQARYVKARRRVVQKEAWFNEKHPDMPVWRFEEVMGDVWSAETRARHEVSDREMIIDGKEPYVRARLAEHGEHVR